MQPTTTTIFLKQKFADNGVELYVFNRFSNFNTYFGTNFAAPAGSDAAGITPLPGQLSSHFGIVSALFEQFPDGVSLTPTTLYSSTNHELGHALDEVYGEASQGSKYILALQQDVRYFNSQHVVFRNLPNGCLKYSDNWTRLRCEDSLLADPKGREFFAEEFAALVPGGTVIGEPGAMILTYFHTTTTYIGGLRAGTVQP
jgi:hypothetical protein